MSFVDVVKLADVATFVRGITFKPTDVVGLGEPGSVACMRTKNVQSELALSDVWAVGKGFVKRPEQYLRSGDTLVSSANSWNLVGKCCLVPNLDFEASFGGFVSVLRSNSPRLDPRYLYRWFSSSEVQVKARGFGRQTTNISNLDLKRCLQMDFPLPSLADQGRIVDALDRIDELRVKRRRALVLLDELSTSLFREMFGDPIRNDRGWKAGTVADAGRVQLGRQRSPKYQTGKFSKPYLRVANVFEDRIDLSDVLIMDFDERDFEKYRLMPGDILLNEGQSTELVGRPAMWSGEIADCCFQNTLVRFQADQNLTNSDYALGLFLDYFKSGSFSRISSKTSSVAHLGASRFAGMEFMIPPLGLQEEFSKRVRKVHALKKKHKAHLAYLDELFASVQQRAFRGDL